MWLDFGGGENRRLADVLARLTARGSRLASEKGNFDLLSSINTLFSINQSSVLTAQDTMDSSDDESNGLLAVSEELARLPEYKAAGSSTLDFDGLLATPLKLHEDLSNGCGGQLWPAGMVLAKYMLRKHTGDIGSRSMYVHVELNEQNSKPS